MKQKTAIRQLIEIVNAYEMGDKYKFEISGEEWFKQTFEKP